MWTKEQVLSRTEKYFAGEKLPAKAFLKYALRETEDEKEDVFHELTPDDMHRRLAKGFAEAESKFPNAMTEEEIYDLFKDFRKHCPQGSPMMGVGNNFQTLSLGNCFVIPSPEDNISSIMDAAKNTANLFKRRAGVGLDISNLRPDGANVNNAALKSTGAWSFSDLYSYVTGFIAQSGRRGAEMITIAVNHPDIFRFVSMKSDLGKVTNANVSVRLSDKFMNAVKYDDEFLLQWPVDCEPEVARFKRKIRARTLWSHIVEKATKFAEPGLIFWDTMCDYLPAHSYSVKHEGFKTLSTNPCLVGSTLVFTDKGPKRISDLVGKKFIAIVDGEKHPSTDEGFWSNGIKDVYKLTTKEGYTLELTDNHKLLVKIGNNDFNWVPLMDISVGDKIKIQKHHNNFVWGNIGKENFDMGWCLGMLIGDGTFGGKQDSAILTFWGDTKEEFREESLRILRENVKIRSDSKGHLVEKNDLIRVRSSGLRDFAGEYGIRKNHKMDLSKLEEVSSEMQRGVIRGLFDSDGSVQGTIEKGISLRLSQSDVGLLESIQRMLLRFGIFSKIYKERHKAGYRSMPDGQGGCKDYFCKATHELVISKENIYRYNELIGFFHSEKTEKLNLILEELATNPRGFYKENFVARVEKIEYIGKKEVFDCTIPEVHFFDANGVSAHNCSEIAIGVGSCRLYSQNLKYYVKLPFTKAAYFDYGEFASDVRKAMRLTDDLVEMEIDKINAIIEQSDAEDERKLWQMYLETCKMGRRTGLGTHGLADALARLCVCYDSDEALEVVDKIYETLKINAYDESAELAKERGPFPIFEWELEKDNKFIKSLPDWLQQKIERYGRRNISILTNAPTGTVSLLSQTSSGIEPVFRNSHTRRVKMHGDDKGVVPDFVDENGIAYREFEVFHKNVQEYMDMYETDELPDYFVESNNIDWNRRVELQSVIQKHIDHSISSTVNLPRGTKPEVVGELYMSAWEHGLKGITVYVEGSRSGILISEDEKKKKGGIQYIDAYKRPEVLECDIHHSTNGWIFFVGLLNGKPYEIFGGPKKQVPVGERQKKGILTKRKLVQTNSEYDLRWSNRELKNIGAYFNEHGYVDITRLVSMNLRHGVKPSFIVDQLSKNKVSDFFSFNKAICRVLKKYIEDDTSSGVACVECGEKAMVYEGGCSVCTNCGYSACF